MNYITYAIICYYTSIKNASYKYVGWSNKGCINKCLQKHNYSSGFVYDLGNTTFGITVMSSTYHSE